MLFSDCQFVSLADVTYADPNVLAVATNEVIPTTGPGNFIQLAIEEAGNTLLANMQNFSYYFGSQALTQQVLLFPTYDATPPNRITLDQVVIDSETTIYTPPLKNWVIYLALRNFYQICSNRLIGDKYQLKVTQLQKDIDYKYWPAFKASGLPIVFNSIPAPGSALPGVGTWNSSNVTQVSGGTDAAAIYDVAITWTTTNGESGRSDIQTISVQVDHQINVSIASLVVPSNASAWNIYVGLTGQTMYQNAVNLTTTMSSTLGTPSLSGTVLGRGQKRDVNLTFINTFFRA